MRGQHTARSESHVMGTTNVWGASLEQFKGLLDNFSIRRGTQILAASGVLPSVWVPGVLVGFPFQTYPAFCAAEQNGVAWEGGSAPFRDSFTCARTAARRPQRGFAPCGQPSAQRGEYWRKVAGSSGIFFTSVVEQSSVPAASTPYFSAIMYLNCGVLCVALGCSSRSGRGPYGTLPDGFPAKTKRGAGRIRLLGGFVPSPSPVA